MAYISTEAIKNLTCPSLIFRTADVVLLLSNAKNNFTRGYNRSSKKHFAKVFSFRTIREVYGFGFPPSGEILSGKIRKQIEPKFLHLISEIVLSVGHLPKQVFVKVSM